MKLDEIAHQDDPIALDMLDSLLEKGVTVILVVSGIYVGKVVTWAKENSTSKNNFCIRSNVVKDGTTHTRDTFFSAAALDTTEFQKKNVKGEPATLMVVEK